MLANPKDTSLDRQLPANADDQHAPPPNNMWIFVCIFLLAVTWLPLFSIHFYRTSLSDSSSGTVVVVFSPASSSTELLQHVIDADGLLVSPVTWLRNTWIVHSSEPGFAGRLRQQGAWGAFSPDLLRPEALLSCFRITVAPASETTSNFSTPN